MLVRRREFLASMGAVLSGSAIARAASSTPPTSADHASTFPVTEPDMAMEAVRRAHFPDSGPLLELLKDDRSLALATWDWGFGDWETALGAAAHMGRHNTAKILIEHGARPGIFTFAMLDQVDAVRAMCVSSPGIQRTHGPHGITLLQHARNGNAERVVEYLDTLGDADVEQKNLPISESEAEAFLGAYGAETLGEDRLVVATSRQGALTIKRSGGTARPLNRVGEHEFNPAGAPHVVVRFDDFDGRARRLTIKRDRSILTAARQD